MADVKKKPTLAECTEEVIAGWKAKHGNIFVYNTTDEKKAYFKSPNVAELEASTALATSGKPVQSNKVLAKACFLGGDECIVEEQAYLLGFSKTLQKIIVSVEGELEPL